MPRVPTAEGPQLRVAALNPVRQQNVDVSSGGRAIGQGLVDLGDGINRIAWVNDEAKANEADVALTSAWNEWENKNRSKYTNQAADGYTAAVDGWWKEAAKTFGADLNSRTRAMVGKTLARRQAIALDQAGKYEFAEKEKYADSSTAAAIQTATVNALKTFDYAGEAQRIRDLVEEQGRRKNWDKDQRDAERNNRLGVFNSTVVAQLAEQDAAKAQQYLTGAIERGEIRPDQQPRLEAIIKGEADNQFATQFAAGIASQPLGDQLAEAAKIEDPQRREKALSQIRNNYALTKQAEQERENAAADTAWQAYAQGRKIPEAVLSQMSGRERVQLQESMRSRAERAASGKPVKTDWNAYIDLREKLAAGDRVDLRGYTEKIGPGQMEQLIDIQTKRNNPKEAKEVVTMQQQVSTYVDQLQLGGTKKAKERGQFESTAQDLFVEYQKRHGRPPDYAERQKMLDQLTVDVVTKPGILWDTKGPAYTLPREQLREQMLPQQTTGPVRVRTLDEARALPKGTRFIDPQGITRIR